MKTKIKIFKRQINCPHYIKKSKTTSAYSYNLIGAELNLCVQCENKLRKEILKQDKDETECNSLFKNRLVKRLKKAKDRIDSGDYFNEKEFFAKGDLQ